MRRSTSLLFINWNCQPAHRRYDRRPATSMPLESTYGVVAETVTNGYLQSWSLVSGPRRASHTIFRLISVQYRICVLSVVRVVAISKLDFADATYNIVLDNIMSALEPTLGVINACLPLLQPIIPKVSETKIVTWFRSLTTLRSSGTGLSKTVSKQPSGESKSHHFERLTPDLYPLSDFSTTQRSLDSTIA